MIPVTHPCIIQEGLIKLAFLALIATLNIQRDTLSHLLHSLSFCITAFEGGRAILFLSI